MRGTHQGGMTSTISKRLRDGLDRVAIGAGFEKYSPWMWTKVVDEGLALVLYLQKSNFGETFYIEVGALFDGIPEQLKIWDCQMRNRIDCCVRDLGLLTLLDFRRTTSSADVDAQVRALASALEGSLVAELGSIRGRAGLLEFVERYRNRLIDGRRTGFIASKEFLHRLRTQKGG